MSERFSPDDIELLRTMPTTTAQMVIAVDGNGTFAAMKELAGMARGIESGTSDHPGNSLIRLVHAELHTADQGAIAQRKQDAKDKPITVFFDEARQAFFREIDLAVALVTEKAADGEGLEYCQWLYSIALNTAEAAKESGFLGFGGQRISETEAAFLSELHSHLNLSDPVSDTAVRPAH